MPKHTHRWIELNRFVPLSDHRLDDPAWVFPDRSPEEAAEAMKGYTPPAPHVTFKCDDPDCQETKEVQVPDEAYKRLLTLDSAGDFDRDLLSQLPLGELFPELSEHQVPGSGASRL